ncbi:alpha/beta hydrolase [Actinotignum urinale]|uniref:alpha/beta hydrolase n=1 Tax=Actinotignum urinale TaxID=190146 RepID=UPI00280AFAF8|nr:alpha/beta fold hydrolase [Actinotignum urinale]
MSSHNIAYSVSGTPTSGCIVALHGVTDNGASLSDIATHYNTSWKVFLLDTLGHGLSSHFNPEDLTSPFEAVLQAMHPRILDCARSAPNRKIVLMGHSMGGAISAYFARNYPELVECLILEDPALLTPEQAKLYASATSELVSHLEKVTSNIGEAIVTLMKTYKTWPPSEYGPWAQGKTQVDRAFVATGRVGVVGRDVLAQLRVPTLIVTGDQADVLFGQAGCEEVEALGNPYLHTALIPDATHTVRRDQSAQFYAIVDRFIDENRNATNSEPYIASELRDVIAATPVQTTDDVQKMREGGEELLANVTAAPGIHVETVDIGREYPCELRLLAEEGKDPSCVVVSIHGGGYVAGKASYDDPYNSILTGVFGGALVASPDYGLAPEHPFPEGAEDCVEAILYVKKRFPDLPLYVYGDSAGAGLARQATEILARRGIEVGIRRLILLEPCLENTMDTLSFSTFADGPIWTKEASTHAWEHYLLGEHRGAGACCGGNDEAERHDTCCGDKDSDAERGGERCCSTGGATIPYVPSREVMEKMPPTMIIVNPNDPLRDEGMRLAVDLADAGVPVELHMLAGTFHGALTLQGTRTWRAVRALIESFIAADFS